MIATEATNTPNERRIIRRENTERLGELHEESRAQDAMQWGGFISLNAVIWYLTITIQVIARNGKDGKTGSDTQQFS